MFFGSNDFLILDYVLKKLILAAKIIDTPLKFCNKVASLTLDLISRTTDK